MLKETEIEETIGFFVTFLSTMAFQSGGRALLATPLHAIGVGRIFD